MNMIKYVHGSADSIDANVIYVFDEMPTHQECRKFCLGTEENRNIIVIKDGNVTECYKGTTDEIQNGLLATYKLHKQEHPLLISKPVERKVMLKTVRVIQYFLSQFSTTEFGELANKALKSYNLQQKIDAVNKLSMSVKDFGANKTAIELRKTFAFQIAQVLGLFLGIEIYTKQHAVEIFHAMKPYLYRETADTEFLQRYFNVFCRQINDIGFEQSGEIVRFPFFEEEINIKLEMLKN